MKGDDIVPLPTTFKGDRPIAYPVAILEHVLVCWSTCSDGARARALVRWYGITFLGTMPTATPAKTSVEKETQGDEEDSSATPSSDVRGETSAKMETAGDEEEKEQVAESTKEGEGVRKLRPRESIKAPERFRNYVAK